MFFAVPYDQKYPFSTLVLKSNVMYFFFLHGSHCLVIGACIFMPENETFKTQCGWTDSCKTIAKFIVHTVFAVTSAQCA